MCCTFRSVTPDVPSSGPDIHRTLRTHARNFTLPRSARSRRRYEASEARSHSGRCSALCGVNPPPHRSSSRLHRRTSPVHHTADRGSATAGRDSAPSASPPHAYTLIQWRGTSAQSRASMSGLSWLSFPGLGGPSATANFKRGERWDGREFIKISLRGAEASREARSTLPAMLNRARRGRAHRGVQ